MSFLFIFVADFFEKRMLRIKKRLFPTLLYLVLLNLNSCKDPKEYRIDSAFTDYLQRFETEAASRGHNFDPQSTGLIIEFANLTNNTAGLTHYETPIRIEIDRTYWKDLTGKAGEDLMKEDLLFHELGHGLLGRSHLNSTLDNGDWKSIMCGGTKVNDRPWNINYRGVRRQYYIDELFNVESPVPDFSSIILPIDTTGYSTDFLKTFDSANQSIWLDKSNTQLGIVLDNGKIRFKSATDMVYLVLVNISPTIGINTNFSYEMTFSYPVGDASSQYGLIFGPVAPNSDGTKDPVEFFCINNNQRMYMGNRSWYSFYTELSKSSIVPGGNNKLKVFKTGSFLYYFINNVYCYSTEIVAASDINEVGFLMPALGTMWLDNFRIAHKTSAGISPEKVKPIQAGKVRIQAVDKSFLHGLKAN